VVLAIGFFAGLISNAVAIAIGRRLRLLDQPHGIKIHLKPVPFTGGLAYMLVLVAWLAVVPIPGPFVLDAIAMWAVGFADDIWKLDPGRKLLLQFAALLFATPAIEGHILVKLAAVLVGVVLVNAFNVLDGLDGLAGGVAFYSLLPSAIAEINGQEITVLTAAFAGSFLVWNIHPARIFLGNQGSLVLGYAIWFVAASSALSNPIGITVIGAAMLWIVVARRAREHRPVLMGDRSHLYDALHRRLGLRATLAIAWTASAVAGVFATIALP
jgi:UDP-GlcNAc:undecaprenyl-phosphate GlcNAc-1-phosphate transferase